MSEHFCKDCKNSDGDVHFPVCKFTGAIHTTGIECPSFGPKKEEVEMNFRVRTTDDSCDTWTVANGDRCNNSDKYIEPNGEIGDCTAYGTEYQAQEALDLYLRSQEPELERTFVGHSEGVLEVKNADENKIDKGALTVFGDCPKPFNHHIRTFDTGATRDTDQGKLDYEGFLHPAVLERYAEYLNKHRIQSDGKLRDSDNWQKGIPIAQYMKSKCRHFMDTWLWHRTASLRAGHKDLDIEESLCAEMFNTMGMLFEVLSRDD